MLWSYCSGTVVVIYMMTTIDRLSPNQCNTSFFFLLSASCWTDNSGTALHFSSYGTLVLWRLCLWVFFVRPSAFHFERWWTTCCVIYENVLVSFSYQKDEINIVQLPSPPPISENLFPLRSMVNQQKTDGKKKLTNLKMSSTSYDKNSIFIWRGGLIRLKKLSVFFCHIKGNKRRFPSAFCLKKEKSWSCETSFKPF